MYWLSPGMQARVRELRQRPKPWATSKVRRFGQHELMQCLYDPFTALVMEALEREAARAGLEMRHPYYDAAFVQFAFAVPERLRVRGEQSKYIHVRALADFLPPEVLERKTKAVFSGAFSDRLRELKERLTGPLPQERAAWLHPSGMAQLYGEYEKTPQGGWKQWVLWGIIGMDLMFKEI